MPAGKKVFVSYSHQQGEWVRQRLVPILRAAEVEVLIDTGELRPGRRVLGEMDRTQDQADLSLLVMTPSYLASPYCRHEMERTVALDPDLQGRILPVLREDCDPPAPLSRQEVLQVDLQEEGNSEQWDKLLKACGAELGCTAPDWLRACDSVRRHLERHDSVNLVAPPGLPWRFLLKHLRQDGFGDLEIVDLERGYAAVRRALIQEILSRFGHAQPVPPDPDDLVELDRVLSGRDGRIRLGMLHFDMVTYSSQGYDLRFFGALRALQTDLRKIVLVVQSRVPFSEFLPTRHPLSSFGLQTVKLRRRP